MQESRTKDCFRAKKSVMQDPRSEVAMLPNLFYIFLCYVRKRKKLSILRKNQITPVHNFEEGRILLKQKVSLSHPAILIYHSTKDGSVSLKSDNE